MAKDKILILGAGNAQIDAINYCKDHGLEVHGCSYTNNDTGIPFLDKFIQIDIKDVEAIKKYVLDNEIKYVYSVGSDLAMPTVMKVCEELGMRHFVSYETAIACKSKSLMRRTLGSDFVGNIPFIECSTMEEALTFDAFPAMMKPTDSQGQRGCYRVETKEDIKAHFEDSLGYSVNKSVIIEKFIDGPEISVNAFMVKGKMAFALVSDRIVFEDLPGGIIKEHLLPSTFTDDTSKEETLQMVNRACEKLNITDGPVYFQIKVENNHPFIVELTPRLDGCHMWNLINHYCKVNLLDITFTYLFNGKVEIPEAQPVDEKMKLAFMCAKPGTVFNRDKYVIGENEYITWYYKNGDIVKKMNGFMEKCGYQIIRYN